jgi:hypothetical protein
MVTRESATRGRCDSDPAETIQINRDQSNIVKLTHGDPIILRIISKIRVICGYAKDEPQVSVPGPEDIALPTEERIRGLAARRKHKRWTLDIDPEVDPVVWNLDGKSPFTAILPLLMLGCSAYETLAGS